MLAGGYVSASTQIATLVVPVAVYFLILGLLNSRRRPQLLSGRLDFALLIAALSPLVVLPVLRWWGPSAPMVASTVGVAAAIALLVPRRDTWVIYNLPARDARDAVGQALRAIGAEFEAHDDGFRLPACRGDVRIGAFPLLRNVSIRISGADEQLTARFVSALGQVLAGRQVETSPMAVSMLLVATGMLVAPLALVAHRASEIVRLLTNLLP